MRSALALIIAASLIAIPGIAAEEMTPLHDGCEDNPNDPDAHQECHDNQNAPGFGILLAVGAMALLAIAARRRS